MIKLTRAELRVAAVLLADDETWHYGYPLSRVSRTWPAGLYRIIDRWEDNGWLEAQWFPPQPDPNGKPRRRGYRLTDKGRMGLKQLIRYQATEETLYE